MKHYILGTDEAGYGPNLGPLVVVCTVWELDIAAETPLPQNFDYLNEFERRLAPVVTDKLSELEKNGKTLLVGDSKKLHKSGDLGAIAKAVLPFVASFADIPKDVQKFLAMLAPDDFDEISYANCQYFGNKEDWHFYEQSRSVCTKQQVNDTLTYCRTKICEIKSRIVRPQKFNCQLALSGNKSTLLSNVTLDLVQKTLCRFADADVTVLCDKHGARNRYVDLLYQAFPEHGWIEIVTEGAPLSVYRLQSDGRAVEFRFQPKADQHIPAALASMSAKLLREIMMLAFNRFWQQHVPDLKPTAGYPVDARRFFGRIEKPSKDMGITKDDIWRKK